MKLYNPLSWKAPESVMYMCAFAMAIIGVTLIVLAPKLTLSCIVLGSVARVAYYVFKGK
jgi:hypothetical protein